MSSTNTPVVCLKLFENKILEHTIVKHEHHRAHENIMTAKSDFIQLYLLLRYLLFSAEGSDDFIKYNAGSKAMDYSDI